MFKNARIPDDPTNGEPGDSDKNQEQRAKRTPASMRSLISVREILDTTGITIRETGEPGKGARFEMAVQKGAYRIGSVQ